MYTSKELAHVALLAHIRQIFTALQQLSNSRMMLLSKEMILSEKKCGSLRRNVQCC